MAGVSIVKPQPRYPVHQGHSKVNVQGSKDVRQISRKSSVQDEVWGSRLGEHKTSDSWKGVHAQVASHPFQLPPFTALCPALSAVPTPQFFPLRGPHGGKKKVFQCPNCRYMTDRKNNLKRHIGTMHSDCGKNLECCDLHFRSKASLRDHIYLFHRSGYRCKFCGRNFVRKALLKRHVAIHMGQSEALDLFTDWSSLRQGTMRLHSSPLVAKNITTQQVSVSCKPVYWKPHTAEKSPTKATDEMKTSAAKSSSQPAPVSPRPILKFWSSFLAQRLLHTHVSSQALLHNPSSPLRGQAPGKQTQTPTPTTHTRLWPKPYKCGSCNSYFSHQRALEEHDRKCVGHVGRQPPVAPLRTLVRGQNKDGGASVQGAGP